MSRDPRENDLSANEDALLSADSLAGGLVLLWGLVVLLLEGGIALNTTREQWVNKKTNKLSKYVTRETYMPCS